SSGVDTIRTRFPEVTVLEAHQSLGVGERCNVGIRQMLQRSIDYLLFLHADTVVDPTSLGRLMDTASLTPDAGLWGPRSYDHSRPDVVWCAGFKWDSQALNFVIQGQGDLHESGDTVHQVDALPGHAMLVRRDVFERVGLFAPEYFFCWEDFDFCARATQLGFKCVLVPDARVWCNASSRDEVSLGPRDYFETRNRLLWARRHLPSQLH